MKVFRKIKSFPPWLTWIGYAIVKMIAWTYRLEVRDPEGVISGDYKTPVVLALWHNRMLFAAAAFSRRICRRFSVLISRSRDGEYMASFIHQFGLNVVRGSSSRGGVQALLGLVDEIRRGQNVIVAVDGPRGPKYTVHPGVTLLSEQCDVPFAPLTVNSKSYWQLKSWDNTQIPKPFTKVIVEISKPKKLTAEGRDAQCEEVKERLMAITKDRS